ncbi:MAG: response regulator [Bryobacteraceae bacterium]|nr:response regulator [Bryobacteraceae bacterium]
MLRRTASRILLVDDDPDQVSIRTLLLEREGHQVETAADAAQAEVAARREAPDLVLMDLRIPRADDGLALIRTIRGILPVIPIVVVSGWMEDLRNAPEAALVSTCLRKPSRSEQLLRTVAGFARAAGE